MWYIFYVKCDNCTQWDNVTVCCVLAAAAWLVGTDFRMCCRETLVWFCHSLQFDTESYSPGKNNATELIWNACYTVRSVSHGGGPRSANISQEMGRRPSTNIGVRKLEWLPFRVDIRSPSFSFVQMHASDGQTDRHNCDSKYRALHYMQSHGKNCFWPGLRRGPRLEGLRRPQAP